MFLVLLLDSARHPPHSDIVRLHTYRYFYSYQTVGEIGVSPSILVVHLFTHLVSIHKGPDKALLNFCLPPNSETKEAKHSQIHTTLCVYTGSNQALRITYLSIREGISQVFRASIQISCTHSPFCRPFCPLS